MTPLARYTKERARRESSTGRRWLQQLAESDFELREVVHVKPDTSLRLGASSEAGMPVTVHEPRLAKHFSLGLVLFARVLPMPAGAVLADGLLMLERHIVAALPQSARASDVFAAWAAEALVAEGHLSVESRQPPRQSPGCRTAPGVAVEPPGPRPSSHGTDEPLSDRSAGASRASPPPPQDAEARDKLLARVRKLFAMAQVTEASPHEAEIALRRCQSLMAKFGIAEKDLETSEFGRQSAHAGKRVPMHITFLSIAVAKLHGVLFVSDGGDQAHFRGYDIDVRVARLTLDYLGEAVERARGAIDDAAAGAGREDGSRVSLDPQVGGRGARPLLGSD